VSAAVVLLHGGGISPWMWEPVVELLPDFRCLTPRLPDLDSVEAIAEAVASLLPGPAPVTVAGPSLGGQVAIAP
jgi:pimeloyl-ACP methyl ester carboxylesterase